MHRYVKLLTLVVGFGSVIYTTGAIASPKPEEQPATITPAATLFSTFVSQTQGYALSFDTLKYKLVSISAGEDYSVYYIPLRANLNDIYNRATISVLKEDRTGVTFEDSVALWKETHTNSTVQATISVSTSKEYTRSGDAYFAYTTSFPYYKDGKQAGVCESKGFLVDLSESGNGQLLEIDRGCNLENHISDEDWSALISSISIFPLEVAPGKGRIISSMAEYR